MRATIDHDILSIHKDDLPTYKKNGPIVRNTYFWSLRAIAGHAPRDKDWEYEAEVWLALQRVLASFTESGYLGIRETNLEFSFDTPIPSILRPVATWADESVSETIK